MNASPQHEHEDDTPMSELVIVYLEHLESDLARREFLDEILNVFCQHCGMMHPETTGICQCWNDE